MAKKGKPSSKAWQQLERDTASHFGLSGRNIRRGMDWSIKDTDVDVVNELNWGLNYIIDCKYRSNSEGKLCEVMRDVAKKAPADLTPLIRFATDKWLYWVFQLEGYEEEDIIDVYDNDVVYDDVPMRYFVHTEIARAGTDYIDKWFNKLIETYLPIKAEQFGVKEHELVPAVTLRKKGVRQTLIVLRGGARCP